MYNKLRENDGHVWSNTLYKTTKYFKILFTVVTYKILLTTLIIPHTKGTAYECAVKKISTYVII